MTSGKSLSASLCELDILPKRALHEYKVTVVVIPDVNAVTARSWSDKSGCWLRTLLPKMLQDPYILEYSHGTQIDDAFSWQNFVNLGDVLLDELLSRTSSIEFQTRPLIFICHGLGGIMLKRALGVLYERFYETMSKELINTLSGIIFFGTPHMSYSNPLAWERLSILLKATSKIKLSLKTIERIREHEAIIANISQKFHGSLLEVPILTAFESKPSGFGREILSGKREAVGIRYLTPKAEELHPLVDQSFAQVMAKYEHVVPVESSYQKLCNLRISDSHYRAVEDFFAQIMEFAPSNVLELSIQRTTINETYSNNNYVADWADSVSGATDLSVVPKGPKGTESSSLTKPTMATAGSSDISTYEVLPSVTFIPSTTGHPGLPCYLLKGLQQSSNFSGRNDIMQRLHQILVLNMAAASSKPSGPSIFAICGVGGVGKTQIAVEFAYSNMSNYDAIFWLHADDFTKLAKDFSDIALALGLENKSSDQVVSRDLVLDWLANPRGRKSLVKGQAPDPKWLLIFDNADDLGVIFDYLPVSGNGSILITSRDPLAKTETRFPVTEGIDLGPLSIESAGALLRKLTGFSQDAQDTEFSQKISEKLSGFPLAILQIAGTIRRRDMSLEEFLTFYENESNRVDFYKSAEIQIVSDYGKTISTVWALEDLGATAACLLDLLSFLDPDQVSELLFTSFTNSNPDASLRLHVKAFPGDPLAYVNARTELSRSSLLKRNITLKQLFMHRLVQDVVRARMDLERIHEVFQSAISLVYAAWPFGTFNHSVERHPVCERIFPHIRFLQTQYQSSKLLKRSPGSDRHFARLLMDAGWYQIERGNARECFPFQELAQRLCESDLADMQTREVLAEVHFCQSEVGLLTSDPEMILTYASKGLEVLKSCNDKSWRTPLIYNSWSLGNIMIGEWDLAIHYADMSINGFLALEADEHYPDFATVSKGYALLFKGTKESLEEASKLLTDHQKYREETFGEWDTGSFKTGLSMLTLGDVKASQGLWEESLELHQKTLRQYLSSLGPKHHRTASVYIKLAGHDVRLLEYEQAKENLQKALDIFADRASYALEICRATFRMAHVQSLLGDGVGAKESRAKAGKSLAEIGKKRNLKLTEDDVDGLLAFWSK